MFKLRQIPTVSKVVVLFKVSQIGQIILFVTFVSFIYLANAELWWWVQKLDTKKSKDVKSKK
jgi:hypothetical protein